MARRAVALALTLAALTLPSAALAETPSCAEAVIGDWAEDGRIDGAYDLRCYEAAIVGLPADLRDYSDAGEVIERALTAALRSVPADTDGDEEESRALQAAGEQVSSSAAPSGPVLLAGLALVVAASTTAGALLLRLRRRGARPD